MSDILVKVGADISNFSRNIGKVTQDISSIGKGSQKTGLTLGKLAVGLGAVAVASKGISMLKNSLDGAISRYDTLNNFPRVLQMMGFDAKESQGAIDKLSDGIDGLPTTLDSVAKTTQRIALMTGDLDGAVDTTLALNNAFIASGSSTADAERGLEQYVQMLSKGEVDLQSWRTLQETMPIALNETAKAFGFTGKSAQNDLYKALKEGDITFDQFNGKVIELSNKTGGFADIAREASGGIGTAWTNMKTAIVKGVADMIGAIDKALGGTGEIEDIINKMKDSIKTAFKQIVEAIPKVVGKLKEVYNTLEPWLPLMGAVASAVVGMVAAWSAFNTVKTIIDNVKNSFKLLNGIMATNPWLLVIGAVILAAILIYKYWDPISEFFINLWEKIKVAGIAVWDWLKGVWQSTVEFFVSLWEGISEFFSNLWNGIVDVATSVWDSVVDTWNTVVDFVYNIFGPLIEFYSNLWTTIVSTASQIWSNFVTMLSGIWKNVQTMASAAWEIIKNVVLGAILLLINLATGNMQGFRENLSKIWQNIKDAAGRIWQALKSNVVLIITTLVKNGLLIWQNFKKTLSDLLNSLKQTASNIWNSLKSAVIRIIANLVTSAIKKWQDLKQKVIDIAQKIVSDAVAKWESLKSQTLGKMVAVKNTIINTLKGINLLKIGQQIIQGFINGIKSKVAGVAAAAKSAADAVTGKIKSILKIASPSRVLAQIGRWTGEGLAKGIVQTTNLVGRATAKLAEAATPDAPAISLAYDTPSGIRSSLSSAVNGTVDVNARDDKLAGAIASLERKLDGLIVEMDGETVGRIVRPHVNDGNALDATVRRYFD